MSTTSSINAGLASLLQNLSNIGSPLVSSPQVVAALQKAPPADIVQLSEEATQLEGLNAIFGETGSSSGGDPLAGLETSSTPPESLNPGVNVLLQDLEGVGSPVLSSPEALSALQSASPSDIVQLSAAATQLAGLNQLLVQPEKLQTAGDFGSIVSKLL